MVLFSDILLFNNPDIIVLRQKDKRVYVLVIISESKKNVVV